MNPGAFDTYITIQQKSVSGQNGYNEDEYTWITFTTAWAQKDYGSVKESKRAEQLIGSANNIFTIHFYPGITADMRILDDDGNIYNLTGPPKEVGRKQYLIIETEIADND